MADYSVLCENQQIEIGKAGENLAKSCTIDYSAWLKEYGEGDLRIRAIRSGDAEPYPVTNVTTENGVATWIFTDADTAIKGYGEVQILYYVEDVLVKSRVWRTYTHRSLSTSSEEVPDPYQDWLSEVERIGSQIEDDAESASDSATRAAGSASEAAESALSAARSESSAQEYASEASTSATSAASSASAASQSASEASTYEYYSEQYMNEAKSARFSAESAKNAAETAKTAAQTAATESEASATAAAQSAEQAEETAESIEESADLIQKLMDNQIKDTATGTIATYPDGADMPMVSLVADIDPIQDLHGYDRPWVGGGGKNKLQVTATSGIVNGVTLTVNEDGTVNANGTASSSVWFKLADVTLNGNYIINGSPSGGSAKTCAVVVGGTYDYGSGASVTLDGTSKAVYLFISNGYTANNLVFKPMLRLASEADATFAPYSNICPISGWDSVDVSVAGKNLVDVADVTITSQRTIASNLTLSAGTYTASIFAKNNTSILGYFRLTSGGSVSFAQINIPSNANSRLSATFTLEAETTFNIICNGQSAGYNYTVSDIMIEQGSTATEYEPYNGQTYQTTLPQTVYGGTLDVVSGVLTVDRAMVDLGTLTWVNHSSGVFWAIVNGKAKGVSNIVCSQYETSQVPGVGNLQNCQIVGENGGYAVYVKDTRFTTDATAFKTAMDGVQLCYTIATPTTIQLTPTQIDSLIGRNNVWADSGDVTVEYIADTKLYIQKVMGAIG